MSRFYNETRLRKNSRVTNGNQVTNRREIHHATHLIMTKTPFRFCWRLNPAFISVQPRELLNLNNLLLIAFILLSGGTSLGQDTFHQSTGSDCPLEGTAKSDAAKTLDRKKNRSNLPGASNIDTNVSLAAMLAPGDDADRFDDSIGATVTGFVVNVKLGGKDLQLRRRCTNRSRYSHRIGPISGCARESTCNC